jgi:hypothetical protein
MFQYIIHTTIPRDFNPDVVGITIDSIVESCEGYVTHAVPFIPENTVINVTTSKPLEVEYLVGQLEAEYGYPGEDNVVTEIFRGETRLETPRD